MGSGEREAREERWSTSLTTSADSFSRSRCIGALARNVFTEPRATQDVDVIVDSPDADIVLAAAEAVGLTYVEKEVLALRNSAMTRLRLPEELTGELRLDVIARSHDYYGRVLDRGALYDVYGSKLRVACAEDVIVLKTLADRPQDRVDVAAVIDAQNDALDRDVIRRECALLEIETPAGI